MKICLVQKTIEHTGFSGLDLRKGRNMSHKVRAELCYASHLSHCLNFKPHSKSSLAPRTVALVVIRLRYVGGRSHSKSQQSTDKRVLVLTFRDTNYPALFIPRGFEESGNGNLSFLEDRGN